ncbi:hypothetical protein BCV70DRAFT_21901 [Testicularia cyperi]|uniref:Uncharacterized protein n=1 Tax=Testicularia cyperi TaxID=1882483 RepID=A0A317XZG3_9BASI|nr:hypothetical protein BCV70DRAFT_21901 [Testicularia cyperi]
MQSLKFRRVLFFAGLQYNTGLDAAARFALYLATRISLSPFVSAIITMLQNVCFLVHVLVTKSTGQFVGWTVELAVSIFCVYKDARELCSYHLEGLDAAYWSVCACPLGTSIAYILSVKWPFAAHATKIIPPKKQDESNTSRLNTTHAPWEPKRRHLILHACSRHMPALLSGCTAPYPSKQDQLSRRVKARTWATTTLT